MIKLNLQYIERGPRRNNCPSDDTVVISVILQLNYSDHNLPCDNTVGMDYVLCGGAFVYTFRKYKIVRERMKRKEVDEDKIRRDAYKSFCLLYLSSRKTFPNKNTL